MASELAALLALVAGVFAALQLGVRWTRSFADWLWMLTIAPALTAGTALACTIVIAIIIGLLSGIPPAGPLAVSIDLFLMPFLAVPLANAIAFWRADRGHKTHRSGTWRSHIFDARRQAQRSAYEAPPTDPS